MKRKRAQKKTRFVRPSGFGRGPAKASRFLSTKKGKRGYSRIGRKRADRRETDTPDEGRPDDAGRP